MSSMELFEYWNKQSTDMLANLFDLSKVFLAYNEQQKYLNLLTQLHGAPIVCAAAENMNEMEEQVSEMYAKSPTASITVAVVEQIPELPSTSDLSDDEISALATKAENWYETWKTSSHYSTILKAMEKSTRLLNELSSDEGWTLSRSDNVTQTYYRAEPGLKTHSFKVTGVVNVDLMSLFAVIFEADLYKNWFPMMSETNELAAPSRFNKICQAVVSAPWPLYNREFVMDAFGVDNTEEGRVLINIASLPAEGHPALVGGVLPPVPKGACRCEMYLGGYMLEILTKDTTRVSFFTNVDPQLVLPVSLLNMVTGQMVHMIVLSMEKAARDVNNPKFPYLGRRAEKAKIYDDVQEIVDKVLAVVEAQEKDSSTEEKQA